MKAMLLNKIKQPTPQHNHVARSLFHHICFPTTTTTTTPAWCDKQQKQDLMPLLSLCSSFTNTKHATNQRWYSKRPKTMRVMERDNISSYDDNNTMDGDAEWEADMEMSGQTRSSASFHKHRRVQVKPKVRELILHGPMTVRELSVNLSVNKDVVLQAVGKLRQKQNPTAQFNRGWGNNNRYQQHIEPHVLERMGLNPQTRLSLEDVEEVCLDLEVEVKRYLDTFDDPKPTPSSLLVVPKKDKSGKQYKLTSRPPIVTIMGHVDHGKTTLLDTLRHAAVAASEHGGITQHIGAFQVKLDSGQTITFIDTPGHKAFTAMRSAGAQVTDIIILVVSADDGVMPQTVEAINLAKETNTPIVVAVNKIDKPGVNPERIQEQLLNFGIVGENYGGEVQIIPISGKLGTNLDKLEEAVLLQGELMSLSSQAEGCPVEGYVLEAHVDKGQGNSCVCVVTRGTLKPGTWIVAGKTYGRVKTIFDPSRRNRFKVVTPSTPITLIGLSDLPQPGDHFVEVESESRAMEIVKVRMQKERAQNVPTHEEPVEVTTKVKMTRQQRYEAAKQQRVDAKQRRRNLIMKAQDKALGVLQEETDVEGDIDFDDISDNTAKQTTEILYMLRADTQGTLTAINKMISELPQIPEVKIRLMEENIGMISDSDVRMAHAMKARILGFNTKAHQNVNLLARELAVPIKSFHIIYRLIDHIKEAMAEFIPAVRSEVVLGTSTVKQIIELGGKKRTETILVAGCDVTSGAMVAKCDILRVLRKDKVVADTKITSLKHFKNEVREVRSGQECGIIMDGFEGFSVGDTLQAIKVEFTKRTVDEIAEEQQRSKDKGKKQSSDHIFNLIQNNNKR